MDIKILVAIDEDGRKAYYPVGLLKTVEVSLKEGNKIVKTLLDTDAKLNAYFKGGFSYYTIKTVPELLGMHRTAIEAKITRADENGQMVRYEEEFEAAMIETVVVDWDVKDPATGIVIERTAEGWKYIPYRLQQVIGAQVAMEMYGQPKLEDFSKPSNSK